jgi:hypothetical protein
MLPFLTCRYKYFQKRKEKNGKKEKRKQFGRRLMKKTKGNGINSPFDTFVLPQEALNTQGGFMP